MIVGTILLTKDNVYVKDDGSLPIRPAWDKELLKGLIDGGRVSDKAYAMLPPSMRKLVEVDTKLPNIPITIKELANADLLIVSRSLELCRGKKFRFENFRLLLKDRKVELWISIK